VEGKEGEGREGKGEGRERGKGKGRGMEREREGVCTIGNRHPPDEILATPLLTGGSCSGSSATGAECNIRHC